MSDFPPLIGAEDVVLSKEELVAFDNIQSQYSLNKAIQVKFTLGNFVHASPHDWIGLFPLDWHSTLRPLLYQKTAFKAKRKNKKRSLKHAVFFSVNNLREVVTTDGQTYQFVYVTEDGDVTGISQPFVFHLEDGNKATSHSYAERQEIKDCDVEETPYMATTTGSPDASDFSIITPGQEWANVEFPLSARGASYHNSSCVSDDDWESIRSISAAVSEKESHSDMSDIEILSNSPSKEEKLGLSTQISNSAPQGSPLLQQDTQTGGMNQPSPDLALHPKQTSRVKAETVDGQSNISNEKHVKMAQAADKEDPCLRSTSIVASEFKLTQEKAFKTVSLQVLPKVKRLKNKAALKGKIKLGIKAYLQKAEMGDVAMSSSMKKYLKEAVNRNKQTFDPPIKALNTNQGLSCDNKAFSMEGEKEEKVLNEKLSFSESSQMCASMKRKSKKNKLSKQNYQDTAAHKSSCQIGFDNKVFQMTHRDNIDPDLTMDKKISSIEPMTEMHSDKLQSKSLNQVEVIESTIQEAFDTTNTHVCFNIGHNPRIKESPQLLNSDDKSNKKNGKKKKRRSLKMSAGGSECPYIENSSRHLNVSAQLSPLPKTDHIPADNSNTQVSLEMTGTNSGQGEKQRKSARKQDLPNIEMVEPNDKEMENIRQKYVSKAKRVKHKLRRSLKANSRTKALECEKFHSKNDDLPSGELPAVNKESQQIPSDKLQAKPDLHKTPPLPEGIPTPKATYIVSTKTSRQENTARNSITSLEQQSVRSFLKVWDPKTPSTQHSRPLVPGYLLDIMDALPTVKEGKPLSDWHKTRRPGKAQNLHQCMSSTEVAECPRRNDASERNTPSNNNPSDAENQDQPLDLSKDCDFIQASNVHSELTVSCSKVTPTNMNSGQICFPDVALDTQISLLRNVDQKQRIRFRRHGQRSLGLGKLALRQMRAKRSQKLLSKARRTKMALRQCTPEPIWSKDDVLRCKIPIHEEHQCLELVGPSFAKESSTLNWPLPTFWNIRCVNKTSRVIECGPAQESKQRDNPFHHIHLPLPAVIDRNCPTQPEKGMQEDVTAELQTGDRIKEGDHESRELINMALTSALLENHELRTESDILSSQIAHLEGKLAKAQTECKELRCRKPKKDTSKLDQRKFRADQGRSYLAKIQIENLKTELKDVTRALVSSQNEVNSLREELKLQIAKRSGVNTLEASKDIEKCEGLMEFVGTKEETNTIYRNVDENERKGPRSKKRKLMETNDDRDDRGTERVDESVVQHYTGSPPNLQKNERIIQPEYSKLYPDIQKEMRNVYSTFQHQIKGKNEHAREDCNKFLPSDASPCQSKREDLKGHDLNSAGLERNYPFPGNSLVSPLTHELEPNKPFQHIKRRQSPALSTISRSGSDLFAEERFPLPTPVNTPHDIPTFTMQGNGSVWSSKCKSARKLTSFHHPYRARERSTDPGKTFSKRLFAHQGNEQSILWTPKPLGFQGYNQSYNGSVWPQKSITEHVNNNWNMQTHTWNMPYQNYPGNLSPRQMPHNTCHQASQCSYFKGYNDSQPCFHQGPPPQHCRVYFTEQNPLCAHPNARCVNLQPAHEVIHFDPCPTSANVQSVRQNEQICSDQQLLNYPSSRYDFPFMACGKEQRSGFSYPSSTTYDFRSNLYPRGISQGNSLINPASLTANNFHTPENFSQAPR